MVLDLMLRVKMVCRFVVACVVKVINADHYGHGEG